MVREALLKERLKMSIKVRVPPSLRYVTDPSMVEIDVKNLGECIEKLDRIIPGIKMRLCNAEGEILSGFDFYINGMSMYPASLKSPLKPGDEITIIPIEIDTGG